MAKTYKQNKLGPAYISGILHTLIIIALALTIVSKTINQPKEIVLHLKESSKQEIDIPKVKEPEITEILLVEMSKAVNTTVGKSTSQRNHQTFMTDDNTEYSIPEIQRPSTFSLNRYAIEDINLNLSLGRNPSSGRKDENKKLLLKKYGGTKAGQIALVKGLRWLKSVQNQNGSWGTNYHEAISAMALIAFLSYGADLKHAEFGKTIEKALTWMIKQESKNRSEQIGKRGSGYQHPMFTLALSEACLIFPENMQIREAMEFSLQTLITGQTERGGFPYIYGENTPLLTLTGWNALALKTATLARSKNSEIHEAGYKVSDYIKSIYKPYKGFSYGSGAPTAAHRAIGSTVLSLFGENKSKEILQTMKIIESSDIRKVYFFDCYTLYYINLAMFNHKSKYWSIWISKLQNKLIRSQYSKGYWLDKGQFTYSKELQTSLNCIMLTIFYRYPLAKQKSISQNNVLEALDLIVD